MPEEAPAEEAGRRTLASSSNILPSCRGTGRPTTPTWLRAAGDGRGAGAGLRSIAAGAGDPTCTFIELADSKAEALELLGSWSQDDLYPNCPLGLADQHEGVIHEVRVAVSRAPSPPKRLDEEVRR